MKKEFIKHAIMLEEQATLLTEDVILEMLWSKGCIYEDVDHYPTLPDSVEELAELLELDIDAAYDEVVLILEEIVLDNRHHMDAQLTWTDLQAQWSDNFN